MNKNLLSLLLLGSALSAFSQRTAEMIPIQVNWAKGETAWFNLNTKKEEISETEYSKFSTASDIRLRVLDKTDSNYTLEWTYVNQETTVEEYQLRGEILRLGFKDDMKEMLHSMLEASEEATKGMRVVYTTDAYGTFLDISNREEIKANTKKSFRNLMSIAFRNVEVPDMDSVMVFFDMIADLMVNDPDFGYTFDDIQMLHHAHGFEYAVGQDISYEAIVPSFFSDVDYPAEMKTRIEQLKEKENRCILSSRIELTEEGKQMMLDDLQQLYRLINPDVAESIDLEDEFKSETTFHSDIDLGSGWVFSTMLDMKYKSGNHIENVTKELKLKL